MNWTSNAFIFCAIILIIGLHGPTKISAAGQAAPYTEEAMKKLEKAFKEIEAQKPSNNVAPLEKHKTSVEHFREAFNRAGYSWDATIRLVAHDLKNKSNKLPTSGENIVTMVVVIMSYMKSHCEYDRVDCLKLFDPDTSEAIKWLWENTRFTP